VELDVVVIGHIAVDSNVLPWGVIENALGGAPTYAGFALAALGKGVGIVSKVGVDFPDKFPPLYSKFGLDTEGIFVVGEHTTTFENTYDEQGNREQVCKHVAPKISPEDIPRSYLDAASFYVSPIAGEITPEVLQAIKRKTNLVMLDPQGVLRSVGRDGKIELGPPPALGDFLRHVDVVKLGKDEAKVFGGEAREVLEGLCELGPKIAILTRGAKPCVVLSEGDLQEIKGIRVEARDLTGAGDVFGAAFLSRYLETRDVVEAARFANAAAALKIKYKGPTGFPSEKEILDAIQ